MYVEPDLGGKGDVQCNGGLSIKGIGIDIEAERILLALVLCFHLGEQLVFLERIFYKMQGIVGFQGDQRGIVAQQIVLHGQIERTGDESIAERS